MLVLREAFKYYFADFVRKGGGGLPPKSVTPFLLRKKIRKGGGRGVPPKYITYFLDQNQVFFEQKNTIFSPFTKKNFRVKVCKGGEGGTPRSKTPFLPKKICKWGGGGGTHLRTKSAK